MAGQLPVGKESPFNPQLPSLLHKPPAPQSHAARHSIPLSVSSGEPVGPFCPGLGLANVQCTPSTPLLTYPCDA